MKRGFTLLELVIVILIIGVLATLGLTQYGRVVEKSRGAEAKQIVGDIRKSAAAFRLQNGALDTSAGGIDIAIGDVNIGTGTDMIPEDCSGSSHYFAYGISTGTDTANELIITATRCSGGGKIPYNPNVASMTNGGTVQLTSNFSTGVDTWVTDY